ncbi:uncharacterized protein LOC122258227 [Penaeus japonicus]|uniref:uncharacterized protein LOC122258227 n=1 Tax=Penaeus japonicus TaxID=27405 RepID=UPI001C70D6F1|nr:uncharacterized protein LOC122258227 [Penaeus japonicus]XP_042879984.1 uncharacterized protein LOC122258227 [Penaeus japonicus]
MNICMRWLWRLWLRSSLTKLLPVLVVAVFCTHQILSNDPRIPIRSRSDEVILDEPHTGDSQVTVALTTPGSLDQHSPDLSLASSGDWMEVGGSSKEVYVYSAYLDRRGSYKVVRIMAIVMRRKKVTECQVWSKNNTQRVPGKTRLIRENWNLAYSAAFILCEVPSSLNPTRVVPILNGQVDRSSSLPVRIFPEGPPRANLSVCVKPFHYEFNRAVWLVEFIEFYRLLGTDQFIFYNHTVGPDVQDVLRFYQDLGLVTVLPWTLPVTSQKQIRTEGIFTALNDCNLRSIGRYALTAMVDVDEYLVPRKHNTLPELIKSFWEYDCYIFQNVFFYLYWENDTAVHDTLYGNDNALGTSLFGEEALVPYLLTAYKTRRLTAPHKPGQRSKYIVRPERVVEVGNHVVWEHVGGKKVKNVSPDLGLSHHYRICEFGGFDCLKQPNQVDRRTHEWLIPLAKRVASSCSSIFPSLGRCPKAPPLGSPW